MYTLLTFLFLAPAIEEHNFAQRKCWPPNTCHLRSYCPVLHWHETIIFGRIRANIFWVRQKASDLAISLHAGCIRFIESSLKRVQISRIGMISSPIVWKHRTPWSHFNVVHRWIISSQSNSSYFGLSNSKTGSLRSPHASLMWFRTAVGQIFQRLAKFQDDWKIGSFSRRISFWCGWFRSWLSTSWTARSISSWENDAGWYWAGGFGWSCIWEIPEANKSTGSAAAPGIVDGSLQTYIGAIDSNFWIVTSGLTDRFDVCSATSHKLIERTMVWSGLQAFRFEKVSRDDVLKRTFQIRYRRNHERVPKWRSDAIFYLGVSSINEAALAAGLTYLPICATGKHIIRY